MSTLSSASTMMSALVPSTPSCTSSVPSCKMGKGLPNVSLSPRLLFYLFGQYWITCSWPVKPTAEGMELLQKKTLRYIKISHLWMGSAFLEVQRLRRAGKGRDEKIGSSVKNKERGNECCKSLLQFALEACHSALVLKERG